MKAVTLKEIKDELDTRTPKEIRELCLRLSKFKKENKELLTYLLFDSSDEAGYIEGIKQQIDEEFILVNRKSYYLLKKSIRRVLNRTKKFIRYSQNKQTEADLLVYFCLKLNPFLKRYPRLMSLYASQLEIIRKKVSALHEDLRADYESDLNTLNLKL
jgi:hypothetical protein